MTPEQEFAAASKLKWRHIGSGWILLCRRRRMGCVMPDPHYPSMWRSQKAGGRTSDMGNLSWAKDAVLAEAIRELAWDQVRQAA
jgi:hypothetical protein